MLNSTHESENIAVYAAIQGLEINFWMGLTDRETEGDWRIESTGEPPVYNNWGTDKPDDAGEGEDYAHIYATRDIWNDLPCSGYFPGYANVSAISEK